MARKAARSPKAAPPDFEYIKDLCSRLERKYAKRNERIQSMRDHRMMRVEPQVPVAYKKTATVFKSPLIFDMSRRAVAITSKGLPAPKVTPIKLGEQGQKNSSLRETWLTHAYRKMGLNQYQMLHDAVAADGMGVMKVYLDKHRWFGYGTQDEEEDAEQYLIRKGEHQRKSFPFSWRQVNSPSYYPVGDEREEVLEITYREDVPSIARRYGLMVGGEGKLVKGRLGSVVPQSYPSSVRFVEYWNCRLFAYYVDDILVKWGAHGYGRPPYWETKATILSTHDPDDEGIGYAAPLVPIVEALNSFVTIQMNWAYLNGFPTAKITSTDPLALEVADGEIKFIPGVGYQAPAGYDVNWMTVPAVGGDLTQMRDFFKNEGNQVSLAPILFGLLGQDVSNSTASTMIAVAKSIFGPGLQGIQDIFNGIAAFMQEQIQKELGEPVPIWVTTGEKSEWLELGPDDIDGYYEVEHTLEPVIPVEQMQRSVFWADLYQRKLASRREAIEEGRGAHDPERVIEEIELEDLAASPDIQGVVLAEVLRRYKKKAEAQGTPPNLPIGMGGPGAITTPGVQSPLIPGEQGQIAQPAVGPGGAGIGRG